MRQVTFKNPSIKLTELFRAEEGEAVLVMHDGKPSALILGVEHHENYDAKDWGYMTDPDFWRMIRERRREDGGVTLEEVEARLAADEQKELQQLQTLVEKKA